MSNTVFKYVTIVIAPLLILAFIGLQTTGQTASEPAGPQLGFHIVRGDAAHLDAVKAAGGDFAVVVFSWEDIEPEPNYLYWEVPDAALRTAEFYDVQIVARLDRPPEWALDDSDPTPWRLEAYANFVRRVVARYGERLAGVIIWNEPNLSLEWNDQSPDPVAYVELLKTGYTAAKAANSEVPVLLAGLAFTEDDQTNRNDLTYLHQIYEAGGADYFDIMAAHPYGFGQTPTDPPQPDQLNFRRLELHRELMVTNGDEAKPVWITEMGWRTEAFASADAWQVVSEVQQADYTEAALDYAAENYPWLERMALWELNGLEDVYGYNLWDGPDQTGLTYKRLVERCKAQSGTCAADLTKVSHSSVSAPNKISLLAPDAIIRLGDRGTLHPHWVHLHRGGQNFSPDWQGEFFLTTAEAEQSYDLLLEVMQIDQPTNQIWLNGTTLPHLQTRTRPDPTSTWVTQRLTVPAGVLQPGLNTFKLAVGQRNPARQYAFWRWENMQFRNVRLVPSEVGPTSFLLEWTALPTPSGWSETNRLRADLDGDLWLTGNRRGEIWRAGADNTILIPQSANRPDRLFIDILPQLIGQLAATDQGLFWRTTDRWQPVAGAPGSYAYVVIQAGGDFYAGFEGAGVWQAATPRGPWQAAGLAENTVLDLIFNPTSKTLYAATADGIFVRPENETSWQRLPALPGESANPLMRFTTRLYLDQAGQLVVRNLDRLWQYDLTNDPPRGEWQSIGPAEFAEANKIYTVLDCCGTDTIVSTHQLGLWQTSNSGQWQRLDQDDTFVVTDATELLRVDDTLYGAGLVGLFRSDDEGQTWQKLAGLPPTVSDLLVDPQDPSRWLAATPAGLYRSEDQGQTWAVISPPWTIWDMAFGPDGRLFLARTSGVAWTDDISIATIDWQEPDGLGRVLFFNVEPHPTDANLLLAGTWGNDVGVSENGGETLASIGNGLETLSVLDVLWHPTLGQVTVATIEGLYRTDDGGQSWFQLPGPLTQQTVYSLLQTEDGTIWAGAADGLWSSVDYGVTWDRVTDLPITTVLRLGTFSPTTTEPWLWAGAEPDGLWLSQDGGQTWGFAGLAGHTVYNLLLDDTDTTRLVAATDQGIFSVPFE